MTYLLRFVLMISLLLVAPLRSQAEALEASQVLQDLNGDGAVSYIAFGDSITLGLGDEGLLRDYLRDLPIGPGYPARLGILAGIPVYNVGVAGEEVAQGGAERFPQVVARGTGDIIGILEGANDAIHLLGIGDYRSYLQKMINVTLAMGRMPVLITIPPPCCNHAGSLPFTRSYGQVLRDLAFLNDIPLADVELAWDTTCKNTVECELFNLPDGLHPNSRGYDVIAETVAATLYGVDIFAPDGAAELESVLGLPQGTVIVRPAVATKIAREG